VRCACLESYAGGESDGRGVQSPHPHYIIVEHVGQYRVSGDWHNASTVAWLPVTLKGTLLGRLLYRKALQFPFVQPSEQSRYTRIAVLVQDQRRTGAGVLSRSSTVEDDLLITGEFVQVRFNHAQWH
jgi:hypothetical protein